ncbi:MAG: sigma 54-interacting transcriptional regulator, partial [Enterococcus sp.]|nr:sigma 54-interacting transcriptional regulator [Enterococcus sp.]
MLFDHKSVHIFESLYDGVLIANKEGVVQYVNESYLRITQTLKEEILNLPLEETRPGSKLSEVIRTGKPIRHLRRKVGEVEYFSNLVPIYDKGEVIGGVSISSEITDVQSLMKKIKDSESMISQLQQTVSQHYQAKHRFEDIVGVSDKIKQAKLKAEKFSIGVSPILITGESGTGKELFAQSIHNNSNQKNGPFIAVNCATLAGELLESELFGYEAGAFTGADEKGKIGLFKSAHGGTIFLDEIGELDIKFQAKLLRVLQEKKVRPIGSTKEVAIDVRVISATNRSLLKMIENGQFREDLYYRLSVFEIDVPPLREREGDIAVLTDYFCAPLVFPLELKKILEQYDWPGNIRELKNTIKFCTELSDGKPITLEDLPRKFHQFGARGRTFYERPLKDFINEQEKNYIQQLLSKYGEDTEGKKKIAEILGIS